MALSDIIAAIVEDLTEDYPALSSSVGERWAQSHESAPPRLVWAPQEDTFGAAVNISSEPRQFRTCNTRCIVHVWGEDNGTGSFAPTEALKNALVAAIYRVCHGYFELGRGTWATEDGRVTDLGGLYLLEVTFAIPITDRALTTVIVESIEQTNVGAFPGGDETDFVATTPEP